MDTVRGCANRVTASAADSDVGSGSSPQSSVPAYTSLVEMTTSRSSSLALGER
jgi:hypothetical protein